ncbi:DUF2782 domain-containing protein [Franzmannia qiaohouensis]|uniref:DUF2782 domain-containing protein n=1 Tax=Franzmannia qiaohouensis TaxID=1329370 RepID=A0ABU1HD33_9GAMM|nr:DUF2782 domain-containing protein [Halomonas qiaohouensis]MDR5905392.1 DUF2782 domain-containing protein [Halomonas qiaohouensis]
MSLSRLPRPMLLAALLCSSLLLASLASHAQSPEPQVTERQEADRTLREFRINGQLYAIEIRTRDGDRYHLLDRRGDGNFSRVSGDAIEVPDWVNTGR